MDLEVSIGAALVAGVISFLSPCVLPLVPPYLCFITGASLDELARPGSEVVLQRRRTMLAALMFVLGFSTVFTALGAGASVIGQLLRSHLALLSQIAGVFIIIMGLNFLGVFKLGFLAREARYQTATRPAGLICASSVLKRDCAEKPSKRSRTSSKAMPACFISTHGRIDHDE